MPFITAEDVTAANTEAYLAKLKASDLTEEDGKLLQMEALTKEQIEERGLPLKERGFTIPYFDWDGKTTGFWRFRFLVDYKDTDNKTIRYVQPSGTLNEVYAPPFIDWRRVLDNPHEPVIITEGELKAACGCKHGFNVLGLGGVNCYTSTRYNKWLLQQLEDICSDGRQVYIAFDSDSASNANVRGAEADLAHRLVALGAKVSICRIPTTSRGQKQGLDDLIVNAGPEALTGVLATAMEYSISAALHEYNRRFIYVKDPGFIFELPNPDHPEGRKMGAEKFKEIYGTEQHVEFINTQSGTKQKMVSTPEKWLTWPHRRDVARFGFYPGEEQFSSNRYNTWTGWPHKPIKGGVQPFLKLIDYLFQGLEPEARKWALQWFAYPIQYPGAKLYSAIILYSSQHGVGKGLLGYIMKELYGSKNVTEVTSSGLSDTRNSWIENKQFIIGDEVIVGDKRTTADRIKNLITSHTVRVDEKYMPAFDAENRANFYLTSQHVDAVRIEDTDRRYFVHEAGNGYAPMSAEDYAEIDAWYKSPGGLPALMHYFMHEIDLSDFNPKARPPETKAKIEMREIGRSDVGEWVAMLKEAPDSVLRCGEMILPRTLMSSRELLDIYDPDHKGRVTSNGLSREMRKQGFFQVNDARLVDLGGGRRDRLWMVRPIGDKDPRHIGADEAAKIYAEERKGVKKEKF